jgi:hypothetical protein
MKISINQDDSFQLEQVYLPITLVTQEQKKNFYTQMQKGIV